MTRPATPRALVIAAALALGALALCLVPRPPMDNSIEAMLVDDSPRAARYADFRADFGADEVIVFQAEGPDARALVEAAAGFEQALLETPAISDTLGPITVWPDEFDLLLDPDLGGFDELERLAPRFDGPLNETLGLLQLDPPQVRIYAFRRPGHADPSDLERAIGDFRALLDGPAAAVHVVGPPVLNLELDGASRAIERTSMPILIGVCVLLMAGLTRSVRQTLAVLAPVGLGVGATMGLLSLTGRSTDIVVNIAQPLLFVLLLASGLHVVVAWQDIRGGGAERHVAPWRAAREKARAVTLALGTTALGFASLGLSELPAVRVFGLLSAAGLLLGIPLVLWILPALLQVLGGEPKPGGGRHLGRAAAWCVARGLGGGWMWPALALLVTAGGMWAATAVPVSTSGVHYFDPDSRIRRDYAAIDASGAGLSTIEAVVDLGGPPTAARVERLGRFADAAEALPGVRRAVGLSLFLRETHWRIAGQDALPAGPALREALASERLAPFVAGERLRLSLLIDDLDAAGLDGAYAALQATFAETVGPGGTLDLTGHHELVVHAQQSLVDTLLWSLLTTALLIELFVWIALRSLRLALAALLPMLAPVCLNFGVMWAFDLPLDPGTCMTGAIALGIAVDDALHFMIAWRKAPPRACALGTGRSLILTSVVIAAGFASLLTAPFLPTARFGLLCALAMVSALLADLLVLPPLLRWLAPYDSDGVTPDAATRAS